ncbi:helix-turn-helix domain-containing protein [Desulfomicrobium orale]|uniref:helix-turn-helix domain-containing protein n=1 Tax=Desulfomicrobium orale TaxID=132132 RepID=UPI001244BABD
MNAPPAKGKKWVKGHSEILAELEAPIVTARRSPPCPYPSYQEERIGIEVFVSMGMSCREIAKCLDRSHPSIFRELRRNAQKGAIVPRVCLQTL